MRHLIFAASSKQQAASSKQQAASSKQQAASSKQQVSLSRILIVSNHPPREIIKAFNILKRKYDIKIMGARTSNSQLVTPELLDKYDVIVTIGKTVQYALLSDKTVYCYDHFGGCGYFNSYNYKLAQYYNFSGRGFSKKSTKQIAQEIESEFFQARLFSNLLENKELYLLEPFIEGILKSPFLSISLDKQNKLKQYIPMSEKLAQLYIKNEQKNKKEDRYLFYLRISVFLLIFLFFCYDRRLFLCL